MPHSSPRPVLLYVYLQATSFVRDDLALLSERYDVRPFHFDAHRYKSALGRIGGLKWNFFRQAAWLMRELPRADVVFGWFADYHMFLPVKMAERQGKPSVVVIGGMDANAIPELKYGVFQSKWRAPLARSVVRHASLLLPNTPSLMYSEDRYPTWPEVRQNGLRAHVPGLDTPHEVLPVGFDPDAWPAGPAERPPVVGCVAYLRTEREIHVKGIDLLLKAAALVPEATFRIVGATEHTERLLRESYGASENVEILPPVPRETLGEVYAGMSVYTQLSRVEGGLPNVVCEAMLCGCILVVSRVGNMPLTVGEAGFVVDAPEPEQIAASIRQALQAGAGARRQARQHVADQYGLNRRRKRLFTLLEEVRSGRSGRQRHG